jgi:hypothetical protein
MPESFREIAPYQSRPVITVRALQNVRAGYLLIGGTPLTLSTWLMGSVGTKVLYEQIIEVVTINSHGTGAKTATR